ncbi:MAG: hypothetical protein ACK5DD_00655 [Cyclobacteriaceae bacterium]|jgi:hypothetical protein
MSSFTIENVPQVLANREHPTTLMWNRLEGRPRVTDFSRSFKAEVRDALWMLTRQWQMGEFKADDAGYPVMCKLGFNSYGLTNFEAGLQTREYDPQILPLEVIAEGKSVPFERSDMKINLSARVEMGQYWLRLLRAKGLLSPQYAQRYKETYKFENPPQDELLPHRQVLQFSQCIGGRSLDGYAFYKDLKSKKASHCLGSGIQDTRIDDLGSEYRMWVERNYMPFDGHAWAPEKLEYKFSVKTGHDGNEQTLFANEYYQGHLDWYAFDAKAQKQKARTESSGVMPEVFRSMIPAQIKFDGMPDTRWWKFEDGKVNFCGIKPNVNQIGALLLTDFALVYSNDWFMIPVSLPIGSVTKVNGLTITNSFGETFWVERAGKGAAGDWKKWTMFSQSTKEETSFGLFLAPACVKVQDSRPVEQVLLIRDEVANLVWGIEKVVSLATGWPDQGDEVALRTSSYHNRNAPSPSSAQDSIASVKYTAMTSVPENWIPFISVRAEGTTRLTKLRRGSMLREIQGVDPVKIKPLTSLLREGLEDQIKKPYFVNSEEVPRSGAKITQTFQRTRWINGEVYTWLGVRKTPGRNNSNGKLEFDKLSDARLAN